jgi:hypothetical protein
MFLVFVHYLAVYLGNCQYLPHATESQEKIGKEIKMKISVLSPVEIKSLFAKQ